MADIFKFNDYRRFLNERLTTLPRGARQRFAEHLNCQPSFISQVLNGKNDLSMEHALRANEFLELSQHAKRYFMLLVLISKAGTVDLKKFYLKLLNEVHEDYLKIQTVVKKHKLEDQDVLFYFNNWLCMSIHMLITIPGLENMNVLQERLRASDAEFEEAISFLETRNLVVREGEVLKTGEAHIHLSKDSPYAQTVVVNTRLKMLEKLKVSDPETINYSSNFTISHKSHLELKQLILDFVSNLDKLIDSGDPEKFCTLVLDLVDH